MTPVAEQVEHWSLQCDRSTQAIPHFTLISRILSTWQIAKFFISSPREPLSSSELAAPILSTGQVWGRNGGERSKAAPVTGRRPS